MIAVRVVFLALCLTESCLRAESGLFHPFPEESSRPYKSYDVGAHCFLLFLRKWWWKGLETFSLHLGFLGPKGDP